MLHNENDELRHVAQDADRRLAAYWVYQGWCNKAPSQWPADDPRVAALAERASDRHATRCRSLRRCIHSACFTPGAAERSQRRRFQPGSASTGTTGCRSIRPSWCPTAARAGSWSRPTTTLRVIDHDDPAQAAACRRPSTTRSSPGCAASCRSRRGGRRGVHRAVDAAADAEEGHGLHDASRRSRPGPGPRAARRRPADCRRWSRCSARRLWESPPTPLLRVFRRAKDLEHMIRDRSWRDLWDLVDAMRQGRQRRQDAGPRVGRRAPQLLHDRQSLRHRPADARVRCRSPARACRRRSASATSGWPRSWQASRSTSASAAWCPASC